MSEDGIFEIEMGGRAAPLGEILPAVDPSLLPRPLGHRFSELEIHLLRELSPEDLLEALDGQEVAGATSLTSIRHAHHRLAMLICEGKAPSAISFLTGYSPSYISRLQGDPMFKELLAYYGGQVEARHVDVMERLQTLGLTAVEELQGRLELEPEKFTKNELQGIAKLALVDAKGAGGANASAPTGPAVAINVQFVSAEHQANAAPPSAAIDVTPKRIAPEAEI